MPLRNFIARQIPSDDVDDVLQEVFIKILKSIGSLKDNNKINTWIYTLTRNTIIDYYRRKNQAIELTDFPEDLVIKSDEDDSLNKEISSFLTGMINRLPEKYKQAIILTEFQNMTQKELSLKEGISISGAKSRVQRARKMLKEMLLDCCSLETDSQGNILDYKQKNNKYC
jgi:RNA polymerase sigma-70 factor (ECF subfamily)